MTRNKFYDGIRFDGFSRKENCEIHKKMWEAWAKYSLSDDAVIK